MSSKGKEKQKKKKEVNCSKIEHCDSGAGVLSKTWILKGLTWCEERQTVHQRFLTEFLNEIISLFKNWHQNVNPWQQWIRMLQKI